MQTFRSKYLSYRSTGAFSSLVNDYLDGHASLRPFYNHTPDLNGIEAAIIERDRRPVNRALLKEELTRQYNDIEITDKVKRNLSLIGLENCYTICTAHQPNIFTGHLYFIYKILHAIRLSEELSAAMPDKYFVPVYYMGSEDADLEELGEVFIHGKKYQWETTQKGAVGRMKVDKPLLKLIAGIKAQLLVEPNGGAIMKMVEDAYKEGRTIEQATFHFVNSLFGTYGLIVFLPDNHVFKKAFTDVVQKELDEQFSHKAVDQTLAAFPSDYKIQAAGRNINLFYLKDDVRERIEKTGSGFSIANTDIHFSKEALKTELEHFPERFSPNVILRPVFQEMILPNVAFIGGGGELAYWLELKQVFDAVGALFPVIILRNSFALVDARTTALLQKLDFKAEDFFAPMKSIDEAIVKRSTGLSLELNAEKEKLELVYTLIADKASAVDQTLNKHVAALQKKGLERFGILEKKMMRAEKKKFEASLRQAAKVKASLYPSGILQERIDNLLPWYAVYGDSFIQTLYENSQGLKLAFCILQNESGS